MWKKKLNTHIFFGSSDIASGKGQGDWIEEFRVSNDVNKAIGLN